MNDLEPGDTPSRAGAGTEAGEPHLPTIEVELAPRVTFATHQAAVPLVRSLRLSSPEGARAYDALQLELACEPPVVAPKVWPISKLGAGDALPILARDVKLDGGLLDRLTERVRADVTFRLRSGEQVLCETRHELTALARNEWGGSGVMPELLAAFIQPNDPAVARLLGLASDLLRQAGRRHSLEGYQMGTRERPWEIAAAIWAAVVQWQLVYAEPPASFEEQGQKIRSPSEIAESRLATCLDTALLFAAALEQAGLNPVVCLVKGHALTGVWLRDASLPELITDDASLLRRYVGLQDLLLFETTLVADTPAATFTRATEVGSRRIREEQEAQFVYALDVKQARGREIHPLPTLQAAAGADRERRPVTPSVLEAPPTLLPLDDTPVEPTAATPEGRIDLWKRRLLDLTRRNRLLNLKPGKAAIRIVAPDPGAIEDRLSAGAKLSFMPFERPTGEDGGRDSELFGQRTRQDFTEEHAKHALERNQLVVELSKGDLGAGLVELYRKAATDLREGGANTLFLAVGTLRWRPTDKADAALNRAPILLVPVQLERASAATLPKLRRHADETVVNMTLIELLRQDFDITIPELMGPLPKDDAGTDVPEILRLVRRAIGDARGWSVENEVVLSTFSFAKYLMWKDLCDRAEQLKRSRFVAHMIDRAHQRYDGSAAVLDPGELDARIDPRDLLAPLTADSSQVAAIHASAGEGDMVLEGPPGTGKSQTIANIIAHNIGLGRRVLFVAEKMTALGVVHERLARVGLGDFCLELHSNKATRRAVVDQLDRAWQHRTERGPTGWDEEAARLKTLRERLNGVVRALHTPGPAGISVRQAITEAAASPFAESVRLDWPNTLGADRIASPVMFSQYEELVTRLGEANAALSPQDREAFAGVGQSGWSYEWQAQVLEAAAQLLRQLDDLGPRVPEIGRILGVEVNVTDLAAMEAVAAAARAMLIERAGSAEALLGPDGEQSSRRALESIRALERYRGGHAALKPGVSHEVIGTTDHIALGRAWAEAQRSFVLLRYFRLKSIRRRAAEAWQLTAVEDVGLLASRLAALREQQREVRRSAEGLPGGLEWRGLDTDLVGLQQVLAAGADIRTAAVRLAAEAGDLDAVKEALRRTLRGGPERFGPGSPERQRIERFARDVEALRATHDSFATLAGVAEARSLQEIRRIATVIRERSSRLNAWCRWLKLRGEAEAAGLAPLAGALETGAIQAESARAAWRVSYCRWLAPLMIDAKPELREFSAAEHERLIEQFRMLDDRLCALASSEIRARLSRDVPSREDGGKVKGYGILLREVQAKRSARTPRKLLEEMGPAVGQLMPCALMSPMSVAQFIPADAPPYDLVIFDEASQITTWDAIGAIARGRNAIIVGDPKQMPPTNFFNRSADEDEAAEQESGEEVVADLESILDEALATGMRHRRLTGHYRSRHESLIAFSNHAYYKGELVTYPPAETRPSAVSLVRVAGSYQRGKERTNPVEAQQVVAEVSRRLRDPARKHQRIGIVTLNAEQQRLIRNLLDDERRAYPEIEPAFVGVDGEEDDMVYNLETVQGHERHVIMISVGYGPDVPGGRAMSMNFGPLNKAGGERRLNVAITRATDEVVVFASFGPEMVDLTRTKARAVEDLKHYLEFAERGPVALRQAAREGLGGDRFDSPFEESVATALRRRGWDVRTQVGVSRYRVDLGVVHPDEPGRFLAGIECDGASYHSSPTARDRDRIRHNVLNELGWTLERLWSTDYFLDPDATVGRLHVKLTEHLAKQRAARRVIAEGAASAASPVARADATVRPAAEQAYAAASTFSQPVVTSPDAARDVVGAPQTPGDALSTAGESDDQDGDPRLYDDAHAPQLRATCLAVVDAEGPMLIDFLAERIARKYGFKRTGSRIRERVRSAVGRQRDVTQDPGRRPVVWPAGMSPQRVIAYRGAAVAGVERPWDSTPHAERLGVAKEVLLSEGTPDPVQAMAARIGFGRLREARRAELEALLAEARTLSDS